MTSPEPGQGVMDTVTSIHTQPWSVQLLLPYDAPILLAGSSNLSPLAQLVERVLHKMPNTGYTQGRVVYAINAAGPIPVDAERWFSLQRAYLPYEELAARAKVDIYDEARQRCWHVLVSMDCMSLRLYAPSEVALTPINRAPIASPPLTGNMPLPGDPSPPKRRLVFRFRDND